MLACRNWPSPAAQLGTIGTSCKLPGRRCRFYATGCRHTLRCNALQVWTEKGSLFGSTLDMQQRCCRPDANSTPESFARFAAGVSGQGMPVRHTTACHSVGPRCTKWRRLCVGRQLMTGQWSLSFTDVC